MVRPKKHLGQHFLKNEGIAQKIAQSLGGVGYDRVVEIGPGMGVLTQFLLQQPKPVTVVEIDRESVDYLHRNCELPHDQIIEGDFLHLPLQKVFPGEQLAVAGNFPYNISSQIIFKALEERERVIELVGMFQKEVAERITAGPGSKTYGILSVLTEAFYHREYLFTVEPGEFKPPPKVRSGVLRLTRKENYDRLGCDPKLLFSVVRMAFNQRRKTLRNALKALTLSLEGREELLQKRAEQLSLEDFIYITNSIKH